MEKEQIDLLEFFDVLKKDILKISGLSLLVSLLFSLFIFNSPDLYKSKSLVSVVDTSDSSLASTGGLSSLFSGGVVDNKLEILVREKLYSVDFFENIISDKEISKYFQRFNYYSKSEGDIFTINEDKNDYNFTNLENDFNIYKNALQILPKSRGYLELSYTHPSPIFTKQILDKIIGSIDQEIRQKDLAVVKSSLQYLSRTISERNYTQLEDQVNELILSNLEKEMLINSQENYAIEVVDKPRIPKEKNSPQRLLYILICLLFSFFISYIYLLARHFFKK